MKQAPSVFIPTTPEGDGIALPLVLSVLAHVLLFGFIIYTHQTPDLDEPVNIETTMVSPEQLAAMQGQIRANREAAMAEVGAASVTDTQLTPSAATDYMPPTTQDSTTSTRVPVFIPSEDPSYLDDDPLLYSREQKQRIQKANQEYQDRMAAIADQLDRAPTDNSGSDAQEESKNTSNPMIPRPAKSSGSGAQSSSTTASLSDSEILNLISENYSPPLAFKGESQYALISITVDTNGIIKHVEVSGPDEEVNKAAKLAVNKINKLSISTDDPKFPTFKIEFQSRS